MTPVTLAIIPILTSSLTMGSLSSLHQYIPNLNDTEAKTCSLSITVKERGNEVMCSGFTQKLPEDKSVKIGNKIINLFSGK